MMVVIYRNIDATYIDGSGNQQHVTQSMSDTDYNYAQYATSRISGTVSTWSAGRATVNVTVVTVTEPMRTLNADGSPDEYQARKEIDAYNPGGIYDSFCIVYSLVTGSISGVASVGLSGRANGAGFFRVHLPIHFIDWNSEYPEEIFIHEWLHNVEGYYGSLGYSIPGLHDAQVYGYQTDARGSWHRWYEDYMQDRVWDGSKYIGVPLDAWQNHVPTGPVTGSAPAIPAPQVPAAGATNVPIGAMFSWTGVPGALWYGLQVSRNASFNDNFVDRWINATGYEAVDLAGQTSYYYRVRSLNAAGVSGWSAPRSFTTGASGLVAGGYALRFDGVNDHVRILRQIDSDFTLEAWIKTTSSRPGWHAYEGLGVVYADIPGPGNDFCTGVADGRFAFTTGNPVVTVRSTSLVNTGQWVHVAAVRAAATGTLKVYVNGIQEGVLTGASTASLDQPIYIDIGGNTWDNRCFDGLMDEVRIWNVARSPAQILADKGRRLTGTEAGLVGYWSFNEGTGSTAGDTSASGNDGDLRYGPAWVPSTALPDSELPTVNITSPTSNPTFTTTCSTINISGNASDNVGVTQVNWSNDRGGSGAASGTTSWSVSGISLQSGQNIITVTAKDAANNSGMDTLTVTYTPPPPPTPPTVTITSPTSSPTCTTSSSTIDIGGNASDDVGVMQVRWSNDRGGSGPCSGTTNWSKTGISLQPGQNVIMVTAKDAANNSGIDTLTVTYTPLPEPTPPTVTITNLTNGQTVTASPITVAGTASDPGSPNSGVVLVEVRVNGGSWGPANTTTSWSTWDALVDLSPGINTIEARSKDGAGNYSTIASVSTTYNVQPGPALMVSPATDLLSAGPQGGPFAPSNMVYTLQNTGTGSLMWTAARTQPWVSLSKTSGTLAAGETDTVTVAIGISANSLAVNSYSDSVFFANNTNGSGSSARAVGLIVSAAPAAPVVAAIANASIDASEAYTGPTPSLIQGDLPVTWSLLAGPSDMVINSATGVVSWPAPIVTGSPYTVTIQATNSAGSGTQTWQLTVIATYALSVQTNSGSQVSISISEGNGRTSVGLTDFTQDCEAGSYVTVTVPATLGDQHFVRWMLDGTTYSMGLTVTIRMNAAHTLVAVYEAADTDDASSPQRSACGAGGSDNLPIFGMVSLLGLMLSRRFISARR